MNAECWRHTLKFLNNGLQKLIASEQRNLSVIRQRLLIIYDDLANRWTLRETWPWILLQCFSDRMVRVMHDYLKDLVKQASLERVFLTVKMSDSRQLSATGDSITQSNQHAHDDGHLSKLVRALKNAEENVCAPFEAQAQAKGLKITGDMWLKIANMGEYSSPSFYSYALTLSTVNDSVQGQGEHHMWVRSTGFDEAWTQFEDRARL